MKSLTKYIGRLLLVLVAISGLCTSAAIAQPGGRLIIVRAPNFGWNIALHLNIDGRPVSDVVQGRRFDRVLPPGRHVVTASAVPSVYFYYPTSTVVMVKPGGVYSFMAMWDDQYRVVLRPTVVTPSQLSQFPP